MNNILNEILEENDICFDIGANKGNKALEMLQFNNTKIVCIEPQPKCVQKLKQVFNNNPRVVIETCALSDSVKEETLYLSNADTISTMSKEFLNEVKKNRFKTYNWNNEIIVKTDILDNIIEKYGTPKYCKIDVEGYEYEVLKGLSKKIPYISIEYTPELHKNSILCIEKLNTITECVYNYSEGESGKFYFNNWVDINTLEKKLTTYKPPVDFGDIYIKMI